MKTNFTTNGIMVSDGQVIAKNVSVIHYSNSEERLLTLSYHDNMGILKRSTTNLNDYTLMLDKANTITGVLPNNEDWYLFWNNQN
jgi:hypothetical protein